MVDPCSRCFNHVHSVADLGGREEGGGGHLVPV